LEKRKEEQKKTGERLRRSGLLGSSISCAQPPHARKVFEVGLGEGLFSKSPSPITRLGSRFRGNDTSFSFRQKRKVGKRKGTQRLRRILFSFGKKKRGTKENR
jgi:hypothetical protein